MTDNRSNGPPSDDVADAACDIHGIIYTTDACPVCCHEFDTYANLMDLRHLFRAGYWGRRHLKPDGADVEDLAAYESGVSVGQEYHKGPDPMAVAAAASAMVARSPTPPLPAPELPDGTIPLITDPDPGLRNDPMGFVNPALHIYSAIHGENPAPDGENQASIQAAVDMKRPAGDNVREWRAIQDAISETNARLKHLTSRKERLKWWAIKYGEREGIDQIRGPGGTVSLKPGLQSQYEDWEAVVLSLIGVYVDVDLWTEFIGLVHEFAGNFEGGEEKIVEAIRKCINFGNLHVVQHRLTDTRVEDLYVAGEEIGGGLTMNEFTKVSFTKRRD